MDIDIQSSFPKNMDYIDRISADASSVKKQQRKETN